MADHEPSPPMGEIFTALARIRAYVDNEGIPKTREVTDGVKFRFRGIDDVMDFFSQPMAVERVIPVVVYRDLTETLRKTSSGKENYNVRIACDLMFQSLVDGSVFRAGTFFGEANDTGDKATAKAQSIAYRQGFLLTFLVPLGGSFDPEADGEQQREADDRKPPVATPQAKGPDKPAKKEKNSTPASRFADDVSPAVRNWLNNQAGAAGYDDVTQVFEKFRGEIVTAARAKEIGEMLKLPENQA